MLSVRRLNKDNTWLIHWDDATFLVDPWLSGSEIDGFKAFNEQWHATESVPYSEVGDFDLVIISQVYHDHCHPETLEKLGTHYPIAAVPGACKKLQKQFAHQLLQPIPFIKQNFLAWKNFNIARIKPNKLLATFYALIVVRGEEFIFIAPHGCNIKAEDLAPLQGLKCKLLITTFTLYQLPFFLGGKINPGLEDAQSLINLLNPSYVLNTHDENKIAKGVANHLAKIRYPDFENISLPPNFRFINDYQNTILEG